MGSGCSGGAGRLGMSLLLLEYAVIAMACNSALSKLLGAHV